MNRKGLNLELLHKRVCFLHDEIVARGGLIQVNIRPTLKIVQTCSSYLKDFIDDGKGIYRPSEKHGERSIMMLAYYKNNLTHIFINEAEIACALLGLGASQKLAEGIPIEQVWQKAQLLKSFLNEEFMVRDTMKTLADFTKQINFMQSRNFLSKAPSEIVKANIEGEQQQLAFSFLSTLILPFIETYLFTLAFLSTPQARSNVYEDKALYRKI